MGITITLVIFSVAAMLVFILAFAGVLHLVLMKTVSSGITLYFSERKKFFDGLEKEAIMGRMSPDSNIH